MQFITQTSHSPKLVSFFAKFIPSEILTLLGALFCLVEINFLLLYRNYWAKIKEFEKQVLTQNWCKSELPSLIFTNIYIMLLIRRHKENDRSSC